MIEICLKIFFATFFGAFIGLERTSTGKQAGIRTHAILCLSTCFLTCLSDLMLPSETPRIISGIVQGIGFIGAGVIFLKNDADLKGLTSSVIIWLTGIVGIIIGSKYWRILLPIELSYILIITVFSNIEVKIKKNNNK